MKHALIFSIFLSHPLWRWQLKTGKCVAGGEGVIVICLRMHWSSIGNFRGNTYFKKTYITAVLKRWNKKVYCSAIKILGTPHARGRSVIINKPWWCCRVKPLTPFWVSQTPQRQQHQDRNIRHGYCRIYLNRKMMLWEFSCQTVQDILSVSNTSGTATSR